MNLKPEESKLSQEIKTAYQKLIKTVTNFAIPMRTIKVIEGTGGNVSIADLIAYQIGWGKGLIRWYEAGIQGKIPEMPGDGFAKWDYTAIAKHFYEKYRYDAADQQLQIFHQVVLRILEIVQIENQKGQLNQIGVWPWCTLASGKAWPFSKWIRVNTASPYKRAVQLIKKTKKFDLNI